MAVGEYYHIYNRGVDKRDVFLDSQDYRRFLLQMAASNLPQQKHVSNIFYQGRTLVWINQGVADTDKNIHIGAYCLMPNHFHLLVYENKENGVSHFLQKLLTGYTKYFNQKNDRSGVLFQGATKKKHVDSDTYLKYLFSYIHLNPVSLLQPGWKDKGVFDREQVENFLFEYKNSSFLDYKGIEREETVLLNPDFFPNYFQREWDFEAHIQDFLSTPKSDFGDNFGFPQGNG